VSWPRDKPIADVMAPPGKSIIGKSKGRSDIRPLGRVMLMTMKSLDLIESLSLPSSFLAGRGLVCNSLKNNWHLQTCRHTLKEVFLKAIFI